MDDSRAFHLHSQRRRSRLVIHRSDAPIVKASHLCELRLRGPLRMSMITQKFGVAPLLALLLHWVQSLPTGAVGMEYKRCTSYRSNTESASRRWHRSL